MMRDTSESDVTSISPSSSSSPAAAYYVQSPSRDSHDEADKCSSSNCHSTYESPSYPRSSMASTSSTAGSRVLGNRRKWNKQHYCHVVNEEEGDVDDEYHRRGYGDCRCLVLLLAFCLVFGGFCLVFWGASRPFKARVAVKSLKVYNLYYGEGSDRTGVPTKFLTVNCSASIAISNPATFFGIHVSSYPINLLYSEIAIANGQLKKYYQPRKSKRVMQVSLVGYNVPLYGTGSDLAASDKSGGIPLKLDFDVHSTGHLVGKLVKTKHTRHISCPLLISSKHTKEIIFAHESCKYS